MNAILPWALGMLAAGVMCIVLMVFAILRRRLLLVFVALGSLAIAVVCGVVAAATFASRSYHRLSHALEPRSGEAIYEALLGKPIGSCVKIKSHRDQMVPKLDTGISLRMSTCPKEMRRVLSGGRYTMSRSPSTQAQRVTGSIDFTGAFAPETLGDTVLVFYWPIDSLRNWRWIYMNTDSTEAICVDVFD